MFLVLGGGVFAYWTYKQNRPSPVWVPLPINRDLSDDKRNEIVKDLKAKLDTPEVLARVSKDLDLPEKWNLSSDAEAAQSISERLILEIGEADTPMGKVPSMNIGIRGTKKEVKLSGEIAMRLMKDVWKILGIKPPSKQEF